MLQSRRMVRQVAMPRSAQTLSTLPRADYEDAFLLDISQAGVRTGEQWARTILENAPIAWRHFLPWAWFALGLRLGSVSSKQRVLGWEVRHSTPDLVLLGAGSRTGMPAELLFKRQQHTLLFATFVRQENAFARGLWAGIAPVHRQVVRYLLSQAVSAARTNCGEHP
jgi:hypothetical protein